MHFKLFYTDNEENIVAQLCVLCVNNMWEMILICLSLAVLLVLCVGVFMWWNSESVFLFLMIWKKIVIVVE